MSKDSYRNFISKPEISFWVPIVTSAVALSMSWMNLSNQINLISQRLELLIDQNKVMITKYSDVERRYGDQAIQIETLRVNQNAVLKKIGL